MRRNFNNQGQEAPPEVHVAKITMRQTIIVTLITAISGLGGIYLQKNFDLIDSDNENSQLKKENTQLQDEKKALEAHIQELKDAELQKTKKELDKLKETSFSMEEKNIILAERLRSQLADSANLLSSLRSNYSRSVKLLSDEKKTSNRLNSELVSCQNNSSSLKFKLESYKCNDGDNLLGKWYLNMNSSAYIEIIKSAVCDFVFKKDNENYIAQYRNGAFYFFPVGSSPTFTASYDQRSGFMALNSLVLPNSTLKYKKK